MSVTRACKILGFCERKYYRWLKTPEDGRLTCSRPSPARALSKEEEDAIVERFCREDVRDLSLREAHLALMAGGEYYGSLSTVQRIMRRRKLNTRRDGVKAHTGGSCAAPQYLLKHPNQLICWDITYLDISEGNRKVYCFTAIDAYSRFIIASEVFTEQTADNAVLFISKVVDRIRSSGYSGSIILHSDNGSQMRSSELEKYCASQGITMSFSRVAKSDDNAVIESTFRTMKYTLGLRRSFSNLASCKRAVWYAAVRHNSRPHSSLNDVTPVASFTCNDLIELNQREAVLLKAQQQHPERFVNGIRCNKPVGDRLFNPHGRPPAGIVA